MAVIVLPLAIHQKAPYGRHTNKSWGKLVDNKWGWLIMELPALLVLPMYFFCGSAQKSVAAWILLFIFVLHYVNRVLIYPFRIRTQGKKIPIGIVISAFVFNLINGSILGYYLGFVQTYSDEWIFDSRFIVGGVIFFIGLSINWWADHQLINLRKPGEKGYKIPQNGLFKWISCPNHFGEIIEWIGYAIMFWSIPAWSFAVWTVANLVPRTLNHHAWYREKFTDYPKERKAVFPFVL